jgi:hypothetical protein
MRIGLAGKPASLAAADACGGNSEAIDNASTQQHPVKLLLMQPPRSFNAMPVGNAGFHITRAARSSSICSLA